MKRMLSRIQVNIKVIGVWDTVGNKMPQAFGKAEELKILVRFFGNSSYRVSRKAQVTTKVDQGVSIL